MAEEAKGQRFSQRAGWFLDKITGSQWVQQTQQTQQQTSGQQSTGGIFLPWISNNQNLINSNKVSMNNWFTQWIQDWTIKSNIVLPWITNKPNEATLDTTTMKQKRQSYIYAKNNNINTKSINEQIEEERTWSNKVLGQTGKILKTYREAPINNFKKRWMRAIADSWLPWYFVDKTLEKAWAPDGLGDSIKDAVNETARKVALTYQNKINEDFQKKVDKNIDARIREKYDNESITDLIWKWDGAWARYKIWKWTVENWNMIPEIWLMFVNPYVWLTAMWTDVYIQENQGTFEDMLQNWATYEQAKNGAVAVWILNAWIELFMERFLWWAKWAWATALRRLFLKNAQREVVKQATKKWMAEIFARWVWERLKGSMVEWFEEVLQQITGNIMVKLINPDRDILDWARESFEWWFYNLFNWIWWATNIANEFKQNEQIQRNADIEALKYVAEWEQRKAQRIAREKARARFLERIKNPTMDNGYTPTPEQAQQRATEKEENEQYEEELRTEQNREIQIENDMMNEVLDEWDINEDLWDPRYQKSDSPQSVNEDTVSERSHAWNVRISPENSSEITKSLDEIKKNLNDLRADTFLQQIKKSISWAEWSNYITNKINGKNYVLRVANHHANANNSIRHSKRNTSIVIKLMKRGDDWKNIRFKKNKNVDLVEFVYNPENITPEIMQGIIDGIQNWIKTGEYTDTNYDSKNQSTRKKWDKKYQLKYEEEWYTPWVARKDEKNISWKSGKMLKDFLKWQTIEELAKKYWVERIDVVKWLVDGMAYGSYSNRILRLAEEIKESTAPHELLHLVFDMVDPETKTYLISQVMQSEWWSAEKAEEWLADSFSNFYRTGKIESAPKSTWGKIKIFFKRVRSFINGMWKWRNQLEQMFTDIIESSGIEELQGKIDSNKEINESKAKMRKRFLEYRRNAEKTQEKTKSQEKYQNTWKNEENEYTNSWQRSDPGIAWKISVLDAPFSFNTRTIQYNWNDITHTYDPKNSFLTDYTFSVPQELKQYVDLFNRAIENWYDSAIIWEFDWKYIKIYFNDNFKEHFVKHGWFAPENLIMTLNKFDAFAQKVVDWKKRFVFEKQLPNGNYLVAITSTNLTEISFYESKKSKIWGWFEHFQLAWDIESEAFKKRFGDSKVVDKNWNPLVVYHWSKQWNFNIFDRKKIWSQTDSWMLWRWFYFSSDIDYSNTYWDTRAFYLAIKNPFIIKTEEDQERFYDIYLKDTSLEYMMKTQWKLEWYWERLEKRMEENTQKLRDKWYDWVIWYDRLSRKEYVVFEPNQIKSATDNVGTYDENNDDIRYQKTEEKRYRWQEEMWNEWRWIKHNKTAVTENTEWWVFVTPYKEDAVKYWDYILEFEKLKENTVTSKEADKLQERATKQVENDLKNQIDTDYLIEQMALWRLRWFAEYTKKPFVETGNPWWEKWEAVFFEDIAKKYNVKYQRVYHWSPNAFDKFDSTHMWEWEGNQAHGRWHYVAVDPKTARTYAQEKFYKNEIEVKWRTMSRVDEVRDIPYALRSLYRDLFNTFAMWYYDVEEEAQNVIDRAKKEYEQTVEYYEKQIRENVKPPVEWVDMEALQADRKKYLAEFKEALEFIEELTPEDVKVREISDRRNFYEVEIPDIIEKDTPTWTNYLEEQAKIKKSEINKFKKAYKEQKWEDLELFSSYRDWHIDWVDVYRSLDQALKSPKNASKFLQSLGYDGIHYDWQRDGECYVIFDDNDLEIKNHEKYQKAEYEYDENGNPKRLKFEEDNGEFDPSIFWEPTREEQIADDKENEKNNPFYNAWIKYNNQNYKDDQLTFEEFLQWISERWDKEQAEYNKKLSDISEAQNDPQLLDLQLRAVKLMEEEWNVGKKFWKNVSKEVRDRQQKEVESKREQLISDIVDYMYPWLKTEEITYDMQKEADQKEAEREMLGREDLEEKLKYFKKDKNWNRKAKDVKIENPDIKLDKILSAWKFEEIFTPLDRVIEWRTPQWQHWIIDNQKNPKQYKSVMEKINAGKTKTKVTLKDVTRDYRALEKYKADQEAEKARKKKERDEAYAKKKQEEYKKIVRMKAFQRLVDMQRFEKYPFLTEEEIKNRYGFTDEERKKITEQEEIKLPKKRWEKAISDLNKAVFDQVKVIRDGLERQNRMKQKDAEKNLWEIWEIDVDILLGRDEEKWQREVEEFEKLAEEEKKKSKKEKNKRLEQAREDVTQVEIDKERENSKSEKERVDKIIKSTKSDRTVWWSIKEFASDLITPVSTRLKEISPKIYRELMKYFQNKDILTNQRLKEIDPFLKAMWKIRKENPVRFMDIWVALANRNIGYTNGLLQEYGVKVPTKLLDTIYDEAEDVGLNINYLWSYYPLSVNSPKSFLEELMKIDKWDIASEIEKKIQEESVKKGWPLDKSEVTAIINSVIAWEEKWPDVNLGNKHLKKRNTEIKRTPKMLEYCDDPISTLIWYVEWMTQSIERAKFLGKSRSWNVHTLADYVYNAKNGLTPEQQDELMELLKSVFNDAGTHPAIQLRRDIATLTTLWSPSSTLTQLSDLSFSIYENGWRETLKAVWDIFASRKAFDLQDMWVINRWEEYTNINSKKNWIQKMIHYVFTHHIFMGWNAFSQFDTFWKSTFIQSTWNKRRKRALKWENGDPQLRKDIMKWTDDEYMTDKIINDLRNWVFSEEVAMVMYMKLGNIQPLTKAQMPKAYLDNPNWRLFYQFKTFGIKQLDYVLQETKWNLKWWKNLSTTEKYLRVAKIANMVFIMTLLWVGADELKDITMRRRSNSLILRWLFGEDVGTEQIWDKTWDNILKLFGLSRYSIMQMNNGNWDKAISDIFLSLPAMRTVDNIASDIHKAFKNDGSINWRNPSAYQAIPVIWKYRYWIYWGGQDKQQQTLDKEKKSTTTWWSSRSTRTTRSRNTRNTRNSR